MLRDNEESRRAADSIAHFIEGSLDDILKRWREHIRTVAPDWGLSAAAAASWVTRGARELARALGDGAAARWTVDAGLDLEHELAAFSALRSAIGGLWLERAGVQRDAALALDRLHRALDRAIRDTTLRFQDSRRALEDAPVSSADRHDLLTAIVDRTPAVITIKDREGKFLLANRRYEQLFGLRRDEVLGRTEDELFADGTTTPARLNDEAVLQSGHPLEAEEAVRIRGADHIFWSVKFPLYAGGSEPYAVCAISSDVTRRRVAEAEARRAVERERTILQLVLDQMPVGVALAEGPSGKLLLHNRRAVELLGHPLLASETSAGYTQYGAVHEDGTPFRPEEYPIGRAAVRGESVEALIFEYRRGDGTHAQLSVSAAPVHVPGERNRFAVSVFEDVSARLALEREREALLDELARQRHRLEEIVDRLPVGVVIVEAGSRRISTANSRALQIFGVADMTGSALDAYRGLDFRDEVGEPLAFEALPLLVALEGRDVSGAHVQLVRGDTRVVLSANAAPMRDEHGAITAAIVTLDDVTDRRRLYEAAQREVKVRERLISIVSHDLRNLLTPVLMGAQVLGRTAASDESGRRVRRNTEGMQRAAERMSRLIDDLVDWGAVQSGQLRVVQRREDACELLEEVYGLFRVVAGEKGIHLEYECPLEAVAVSCDRDRVLQALSNILSNALKVVPEGGSIRIRAERSVHELLVSIADTGPGIPPGDLARLFDQYWRGTRASYKGTGLGLAITRGIVEAHGGRIWVESTVGAGTRFTFTLPLDLSGPTPSGGTPSGQR